MKRTVVLLGLLLLLATICMGQDKNAEGTWKTEAQKGQPPATLTILKDTPDTLSWRVKMKDDKGKPMTMEWSGPKDGSMHPVKVNGTDSDDMQSAKMEDNKLHRHGEMKGGGSFDAYGSMSDDGNTISEETTEKDKDGKEKKSSMTYHRMSGAGKAKAAAKKSGQ